MPAYITHSIMASDLYNNYSKELFRIALDINEIRAYSLGADLAYCRKYDNHRSNVKDFFITLIKYIKDNDLTNNKHVIALLYGHIMHYCMDISLHPYIFYLEKGTKRVGLISPHTFIEGYLDYYFCEPILNKNISKLKSSFFNKVNLKDKVVVNMLNTVYKEVYKDNKVINKYKLNMTLFTLLNTFTNNLIGKNFLKKASGYNKFIKINNIKDILNESKITYTNPITGTKEKKTINEMYKESISMSINAIKKVNEYLYDNKENIIDKIFEDISYDTGVLCSLGYDMKYIKNYK